MLRLNNLLHSRELALRRLGGMMKGEPLKLWGEPPEGGGQQGSEWHSLSLSLSLQICPYMLPVAVVGIRVTESSLSVFRTILGSLRPKQC